MPITTCDSPEILRAEIETIRRKVSLNETEETWDTIAQSIVYMTHLCNNGGCEFPSEMIAGIRSVSRPLNNALGSERSRLSGTAVELVTAVAIGLGSSFEPLVSQFVPTLLALCCRTNKVFTSRARACILIIVQHTRLPSLLPHLTELANHKSVFPRLTAAEGILACLNCFNPPDLEKESRARVVEDFIKLTARDASADVRKASKEIFRAYKTLLPARVDNFVAPLTPVVKKYLDIQGGPPGITSNVGQKQSSRPSSRANNKAIDTGQRPSSSTFPEPSTRPVADNLAHSAKQRPPVRGFPTVVDIRAPRQRTVSQARRGLPQPCNLHITAQSSSASQRCVVPGSVPICQTVQRPPPGAARIIPTPKAASTGGPQRPPPVQLRFNPPPDRLKVTRDGAKRIPLPSVPVDGHASGQAFVATDSGGRLGSTVHKPRPKPPSRSAEAIAPRKLAISRKPPEGHRLPSSSTKPVNKAAPVGAAAARSHQQSVKGGTSNPNQVTSQQHPAGDVQKSTPPPVKAVRQEASPTLIPLPPSPSVPPTEIPLPPSPDCTPDPVYAEALDEPAIVTLPGSIDSAGKQLRCAKPLPERVGMNSPSTPITALLSSIQRGFLFTPSTPLSPPQNYLPVCGGGMPEKRQGTKILSDVIKDPLAGVPICISLEDNSPVDGLDRHALRDLN